MLLRPLKPMEDLVGELNCLAERKEGETDFERIIVQVFLDPVMKKDDWCIVLVDSSKKSIKCFCSNAPPDELANEVINNRYILIRHSHTLFSTPSYGINQRLYLLFTDKSII
jgi:hypothetical protein